MIKELIKNGENKTLEFKENITDSLINSVVAFANTTGGKILIGISDNGDVKGIDENNIFKVKDSLAQSIFYSITPKIIPEIYTINVDNKLILVIEIYPSNLKPYFISSKGVENSAYIRVGATNRLANKAIITELEREKSNISFDEEINLNYNLNDFILIITTWYFLSNIKIMFIIIYISFHI